MKFKIKRDKDNIRFSGRRHSITGVLSAVIGIVVTIGFVVISIISGLMKGQGSQILGLMGLLFFALAIYGSILAYKAFNERDVFYRFPIIGAALNGIMTILLMILYILGVGMGM